MAGILDADPPNMAQGDSFIPCKVNNPPPPFEYAEYHSAVHRPYVGIPHHIASLKRIFYPCNARYVYPTASSVKGVYAAVAKAGASVPTVVIIP